MPRKPLLATLLALSFLIAGCGGGGGSGIPTGPFIPWAKFRRDANNTGVASDNLINNDGKASLFYASGSPEEMTISTPAIDGDDNIYYGTADGLIAIDKDGSFRWQLRECSPGDASRALGRIVSSPTIVANDKEILVGTEGTDGTNGAVFHVGDIKTDTPTCLWAFPEHGLPFATRSSPVTLTDVYDFALLSMFIGTSDGHVIALDMNGMRRWTFPGRGSLPGNLSSSPTFSTTGLLLTAPDGRLYSLDESGGQQWTFQLGDPLDNEGGLLPSPATQNSVFAVQGRRVYALNVDGTERWHYDAADEIVGSPATSFLTIPRGGGRLTSETLVYTVDRSGTLAAVVNSSGKVARYCSLTNDTCVPSSCPGEVECVDVRRCSDSADLDCDSDSDCPQGENCVDTGRCNQGDGTLGMAECTPDTCLEHNDAGHCTREAVLPITTGADITVVSSPVLSTDSLTLVATTDARICARRIDGSVPGGKCMSMSGDTGRSCVPDSCGTGDHCCTADDTDCPIEGHCRGDPTLACTPDDCPEDQTCATDWRDGCIRLPETAGTITLSSPIIDRNGAIFVTTEKGLVKVE